MRVTSTRVFFVLSRAHYPDNARLVDDAFTNPWSCYPSPTHRQERAFDRYQCRFVFVETRERLEGCRASLLA